MYSKHQDEMLSVCPFERFAVMLSIALSTSLPVNGLLTVVRGGAHANLTTASYANYGPRLGATLSFVEGPALFLARAEVCTATREQVKREQAINLLKSLPIPSLALKLIAHIYIIM